MSSIRVHNLSDNFASRRFPRVRFTRVRFRWPYGGMHAFVVGSFDGWVGQYEMSKFDDEFICFIILSTGVYEYKFIVDGEWVYDINRPSITSNINTINNHIIIGGYPDSEDPDSEEQESDDLESWTDESIRRELDRIFEIPPRLWQNLHNLSLTTFNDFFNFETENYSSNEEKNIYHAMDTLKGINFKELEVLANDKINDACAICLMDLKENEDALFVVLECSHVFHRDCIVRVNNNMCPLCKKPIINNLC
jgi:hypothetical protein